MNKILAKLLKKKQSIPKSALRGRVGGKMNNPETIKPKEFGGGVIGVHTELVARHLRRDEHGEYKEIGRRTVKDKCITDDFVEFVIAQLQTETSAFGDFKYHDSGEGVAAEDATDSALQTPCGEARTVGTQVEGATTKQYKSIATHTYAGGFTITEHGLFNAAAAGILMDRTVFGGIAVVATDKIEYTFTITMNSGG